jgi:uncharacterized membrane protein YqiK
LHEVADRHAAFRGPSCIWTAVADMQAEVVRSEQTVRISNQTAMSEVETARGRASAARILAEAEADATRPRAAGDAEAIRLQGTAKADAYRLGMAALGSQGYVSLQIAGTLAENKMKIVPDIAVGGGNGHGGGLADVLIASMLKPSSPA